MNSLYMWVCVCTTNWLIEDSPLYSKFVQADQEGRKFNLDAVEIVDQETTRHNGVFGNRMPFK